MTAGKWLKTACNLCYINCGIEVLVNDGRPRKCGRPFEPKSQGYLCNKATRSHIMRITGSAHDSAAPSRGRRLR
jgi:anaerobic selenocysteine-containing dehydrogenase